MSKGTKILYKNAEEWKKFGNIVESGETDNAMVGYQDVNVVAHDNTLTVSSPVSENITVYSTTRQLLYQFNKPDGSANFFLASLPGRVIIVKGATGWTRKLFR
jgi:hypothetical protein